jgi:hypothetical protein
VEGISKVTGETAQGTQQIARAAEDLNRLTDNLQQLVSQFKLGRGDGERSRHAEPKSGKREPERYSVQEMSEANG